MARERDNKGWDGRHTREVADSTSPGWLAKHYLCRQNGDANSEYFGSRLLQVTALKCMSTHTHKHTLTKSDFCVDQECKHLN